MIRVRRVGRVRPVGRVGRGKRVRRVNGWTLTKTDLLPRDPRQTRRKKGTHIEKSKTLFSKSERSDLYVDLSRQLYLWHTSYIDKSDCFNNVSRLGILT